MQLGALLAHLASNAVQRCPTGQKKHQEFVDCHNAFDKKCAAAAIKGFSGYWEPKTAAPLAWMASELNPPLRSLARQLNPQPPIFIAGCGD